jgi:PAS domain S-box-containing protein
MPTVLVGPAGQALGRLRRIGARGLLALLTAAALMLVSVLGALLPDATLPLTWYVPVLDSAMVVTLAVVLALSSADVVLRRHGRSLPLVLASVVLGILWLQHMLTLPGVLPFRLPFATNQTSSFFFHVAHIGTPLLYAGILLHRPRPLEKPRRSLLRTVALALGISLAAIAVTAALALVLPPMIVGGRFTDLNTLLQAAPFLVVAFAAAMYRKGRCPERRIEASVIVGLVLVTVETMMFMFMRARYDGFWYVGHALLVMPSAALLVGTLGLYVAARREADVQLRVMERLKESERHLQIIIDTSPSAVITADQTGMITGWNRKAEEIFGWSHDEAIGRTLAATIIPRRYRDNHQRGLARFIETGEGKILGRLVELSALHRDGHEFPVEISISPTSRTGSRVEFVAFVTDISHRRMADRLRSVQFAVTRPLANAATWAEAAPQVL